VPWRRRGFIDRLNDAGIVDVLVLLERVDGFTLFGYLARAHLLALRDQHEAA
jgi:hypothetical protein